ncbi:MAG: Na(+)-translocating NADH-quinone reductase subunit A [Bacteroidales bacterium]|nr:Na(+)-translocating NADH-quinone reductase subunit A [Bacteroidales bacterium]
MSETIVLKRGLDIPVNGCASLLVSKSMNPAVVAVEPGCVKGLLPRLLVKEGDRVLCGSPVIADKKNPDILLTAPASGTVKAVVRGEKRKLLAVLIEADDKQEYVEFGAKDPSGLTADEVMACLLKSGLWPLLIQRPYGILADPAAAPKGIFVSAFNTAPLAADNEFALGGEIAAIQKGIDALARIAPVHVSLDGALEQSAFAKLGGCTPHSFKGRHPAGNVGVQISHISPIRKGETVWTVSLHAVAAIGKLFASGRYNVRRKVAVTGPAAIEPSYVETLPGTPMKDFAAFYGSLADEIRFISGDLLSGTGVGADGYLGLFDDQVTLIREGVDKELLGWIRPFRFNQFSNDRSYFSWLLPCHKWDMDTNLHGGPRPFLMNENYYAKVLPMDIYPIFLAKACLAGDIEKMEKYGIYEVLPEDLALCEFVDPSKNYIQDIIARGIDLMLKEMA